MSKREKTMSDEVERIIDEIKDHEENKHLVDLYESLAEEIIIHLQEFHDVDEDMCFALTENLKMFTVIPADDVSDFYKDFILFRFCDIRHYFEDDRSQRRFIKNLASVYLPDFVASRGIEIDEETV